MVPKDLLVHPNSSLAELPEKMFDLGQERALGLYFYTCTLLRKAAFSEKIPQHSVNRKIAGTIYS